MYFSSWLKFQCFFFFKTKFRVFSTGQALSFEELMRRVQPKQIVQRTRDEIIVKKMDRIDGTMVSVNDFRHFEIKYSLKTILIFLFVKAKRMIPERFQLYQKKMKLQQQLAEVKNNIEAKKKEFTDLSTAMKNKSKR